MKKLHNILLLLFFVVGYAKAENIKLQFRKDKSFKILQLTDTHWDNNSKKCKDTRYTITNIIQNEKPDFIIITGDIVTKEPVKEGWEELSKIISSQNIPWSVTFGNHDEEGSMTKKEIWKLLKTKPNFIGKSANVSGTGNCAIPIYNYDGNEIASVLYLFDSHDYTKDKKNGHYDWIKFDQIQWYKLTSKKFTKKNHGKPLPSLSFFHIPLLEFKQISHTKNDYLGDKYEGIASSDLNSGLFTAMIEQKDIMGIFTGHDHDNNYIGILKNIALAFGQVSGADAYGKLKRGGRIIELHEGKKDFKTWISTPNTKKYVFYYPSGLSDITDSTKVLSATKINLTKNGVKYNYYEGKIQKTSEISSLKEKSTGVLHNFTIKNAKIDDYFAFKFTTWIKIPHTALYKFYTRSDDGSVMLIDNKLIVDNDGGHSAKREDGIIGLQAGFHKIELLYFEKYMGNELEVGISSVLLPESKIPDKMLFYNIDTSLN